MSIIFTCWCKRGYRVQEKAKPPKFLPCSAPSRKITKNSTKTLPYWANISRTPTTPWTPPAKTSIRSVANSTPPAI